MTGSRNTRNRTVNTTNPAPTPSAAQKKKPLSRRSGVRKNGKNLTTEKLIPSAENWAYRTASPVRILTSPTCSSVRKFVSNRILLTYPIRIPR